MASYFGEIVEPPTRALFDDCSDEELPEVSRLQITWKQKISCPPIFRSFLLVEGSVALAFAEAYLLNSQHTLVGHISQNLSESNPTLSAREAKSQDSPIVLQDDLLICFVHPTLQPKVAYDFADLVSPLCQAAGEVVILTSQPSGNYKGPLSPASSVFSFASSSYKGTPVRSAPASANIISGISAGVGSWCEVNNIAAVVYAYYSDTDVLDSISAQPLQGILPQRTESPDLKSKWKYGGAGQRTVAQSNMYM